MPHFLTLGGLPAATITSLLDASAAYKARRQASVPAPAPWLAGKTVAVVLEKASTRTRVGFEVAINELGGHPIVLSTAGSQLGRGEPVEDTARVLGRMCHGIVYRTFGDERLQRMAAASGVPVVNALTDQEHPCQIIADLLTVRERLGSIDVTYAWIGDGNNMAVSWIHAAAAFGLTLTLACPEGYHPDPDVVADARAAGATVNVVADPVEAAKGADVIMTDVWASMGQEEEARKRAEAFAGYLVDDGLFLHASGRAIALHCLPAHRGEEIAASVIDGPRGAAIWDQAENRLHTHKAILELAFTGRAHGP
jgi:ornithine carbamoyltransferase